MIDGVSDFWCKFDIQKSYQDMNISLIKGVLYNKNFVYILYKRLIIKEFIKSTYL